MFTKIEDEDLSAVSPRRALPLALMRLLNRQWRPSAPYSAIQLGIADVVADGMRTAAQLAEARGCHAPSVYRLLYVSCPALTRLCPTGRVTLCQPCAVAVATPEVPRSVSAVAAMSSGSVRWIRGCCGRIMSPGAAGCNSRVTHRFSCRSTPLRSS